ncbi:MAG: FAD:protein FMN transferase, partial [Solirubrobacterales bacterium]
MSELSFRAMGTSINLRIEGAPAAQTKRLLASGRRFIENFDQTLSRFNPSSELSRVNSDPREAIPVGALMGQFVDAALWSAESSAGLVDPTLTPALINAGYGESRVGKQPANLKLALEEAPAR